MGNGHCDQVSCLCSLGVMVSVAHLSSIKQELEQPDVFSVMDHVNMHVDEPPHGLRAQPDHQHHHQHLHLIHHQHHHPTLSLASVLLATEVVKLRVVDDEC
jgi:hypothetical protein